MIHEIVAHGGTDTTGPDEDRHGHFRASYRGYHLWFVENDAKLHVARQDDFDRWANSRVYEGEAPCTIDDLDAVLDGLDRLHDTIEKYLQQTGKQFGFYYPPASREGLDALIAEVDRKMYDGGNYTKR